MTTGIIVWAEYNQQMPLRQLFVHYLMIAVCEKPELGGMALATAVSWGNHDRQQHVQGYAPQTYTPTSHNDNDVT